MSSLGPIEVGLPPDSLSTGETEEQNNNTPGRLDLDPFHPGNADAYLDVFFEVVIDGVVFHTEQARRISTVLTTQSDSAAVFTSTEMTTLFDENGQPSTLALGEINHNPVTVSVEVVTVGEEIPTGFELGTNYPNPFNAETVIPFGVPKASPVRIEVYDVLGRRVATLLDETVAAGRHEVTWRVQALPAGVYLIRLTVGNVIQTQRATLMK